MKDIDLLKQNRTVTYITQQHVANYVTGFEITYNVYKQFLKRLVVFDVRTKYHENDNFQPYRAKVAFCAGELGNYDPAKFDLAKFSFDRFQSEMYQSSTGWNVSYQNIFDTHIDFRDYVTQPCIDQTLYEINTAGTLPSLDADNPNVIVVSYRHGILVPNIQLVNGKFQFSFSYPVDDYEPLIWFYNSKLTLFVQTTNLVHIDGEVDEMSVSQYCSVPLDITLDELGYMQIDQHNYKKVVDISL